jgi:alpha-1,2-mannosyltransferase
VGLALLRRRRSAAAAVILGLAAVLKPPLALMGLLFLLRREIRALAAFALTGVTAILLSVGMFGIAENLHWLHACVLAFSRQWLAAFNVQSIPAFLMRLSSPPEGLMDWTGHEPVPSIRLASELLTGALVVIAGAAILQSSSETKPERWSDRLDLSYLLILCLCILTSPLAWSHYYAWLLAPVAWLLQPQRSGAVLRWSAILLLSPLVWPLNPAVALIMTAYRTGWSSHLLLGGLMIFGLLAWRLVHAGQRDMAAQAAFAVSSARRQMT